MKYISDALVYDENAQPDPFSPTIDAICSIEQFDYYIIPQHLQGNLQALAKVLYQDPQLFWVLQFFNGVCYPHELKTGLKLKVPSKMEVEYILGQQLNDAGNNEEVYI